MHNQLRKMRTPVADPANWEDITGLEAGHLNINMQVFQYLATIGNGETLADF